MFSQDLSRLLSSTAPAIHVCSLPHFWKCISPKTWSPSILRLAFGTYTVAPTLILLATSHHVLLQLQQQLTWLSLVVVFASIL